MTVCFLAELFLTSFYIVVGERSDQGAPISVRAILSDINLVFSLMMATFSAAIWASIDPILEPELRNKVCAGH